MITNCIDFDGAQMPESFYYQIHPIGFPLLSEEEQEAVINAFMHLLNALSRPITFIVQRSEQTIPLEDTEIRTTVYSFYVVSQERIDRLLEQCGLRYEPLLEPPPSLLDPRLCRVGSKHVVCRGRIYKVLTIYGLPPRLRDGWLYEIYPLIDETRIHVVPVAVHHAYKLLRSRRRILQALVASYDVEGRIPRYEVVEEFQHIDQLLQSLVRREAKLFAIRTAFVVGGDSHSEVREKAEELRRELESMGFAVDSPAYAQWLIYELKEPSPIYTDSLTLSTFFPFISTTLMEIDGIFLGRSRLDESPVFLDVWSHKSYNVTVLGVMGSGKSAFAKKVIYEYSRKLDPDRLAIFVIDRTGEYVPVLSSIGAQIVEVRRGQNLGFDPFKLLPPEHAAAFIASHISLDPRTYAELQRLAAKHRSLSEVYENASRELKQMLSGLVEGPLGWIYRGEPLQLSNRVGVVLRDLGSPEAESLVGAMFLLAFIQKIKALPVDTRKILVIDEFLQVLEAFRTYDVISWLLMFFKNTRKWYTSIIYIAHDPREVADTRHGRVIAAQLSAIKVLFQHDVDAARASAELFGLSEAEMDSIINAGVGDCLLIAEGIRLPVHIELSRRELELVETRPFAVRRAME